MMTDPYDPEGAFVGAILHMPVPMAAEALDLIHNDDIADLLNLHIVQVARVLIAEGVPTDPVAVLARARADGIVTGAEAIRALTMRLHDLYAAVPTPAAWRHYGLAVIDEALRRQWTAMATRVMQAAASSGLDVVIDLFDAECRPVRRLHDRRLAAAGQPPTRLRVAG
jgi:replicative DNA helicase